MLLFGKKLPINKILVALLLIGGTLALFKFRLFAFITMSLIVLLLFAKHSYSNDVKNMPLDKVKGKLFGNKAE